MNEYLWSQPASQAPAEVLEAAEEQLAEVEIRDGSAYAELLFGPKPFGRWKWAGTFTPGGNDVRQVTVRDEFTEGKYGPLGQVCFERTFPAHIEWEADTPDEPMKLRDWRIAEPHLDDDLDGGPDTSERDRYVLAQIRQGNPLKFEEELAHLAELAHVVAEALTQ